MIMIHKTNKSIYVFCFLFLLFNLKYVNYNDYVHCVLYNEHQVSKKVTE